MRRIGLAVALALGVTLAPLAAETEQTPKLAQIGYLSIAARTPEVAHLIEAFSQGLRERGYGEGQDLAIEYRFADGKPDRLPGLAAELLRFEVDIIVAPTPAECRR
jgi:putative ABC transport system substrate-binding protein